MVGLKGRDLPAAALMGSTTARVIGFSPQDVLVVPEYAFGADSTGQEITLSTEHEEYRWADYLTAQELLCFDSNKNALWELDFRLPREGKFI